MPRCCFLLPLLMPICLPPLLRFLLPLLMVRVLLFCCWLLPALLLLMVRVLLFCCWLLPVLLCCRAWHVCFRGRARGLWHMLLWLHWRWWRWCLWWAVRPVDATTIIVVTDAVAVDLGQQFEQ